MSDFSLLELLAKNEERMARLYELYAKHFPFRMALWNELVANEKEHAQWIYRIVKLIQEKKMFLNAKRFNREPIEGVARYIDKQIARAANPQLTDVEALSTALDIEQSLLERQFFEVAETDSVEMKKAFENLAKQTQEHKNLLWQEWSKVQRQGK